MIVSLTSWSVFGWFLETMITGPSVVTYKSVLLLNDLMS